jgi:hypothetical protein
MTIHRPVCALAMFLVLCLKAPWALADASQLPIADVHFHYMGFMSPQELRSRMDKHNIR